MDEQKRQLQTDLASPSNEQESKIVELRGRQLVKKTGPNWD